MKKTLAVLALSLAGAASALAGPTTAVNRTYKAVFDVQYDINGTFLSVPVLEIQNPKANTIAMTVTGVNVVWNPFSALTTPVPGIVKHAQPTTCTRVSASNPVTLLPGDGITIDALTAITGCSVPSCGQPCWSSSDCTASCFCLRRLGTQGRCLGLPTAVRPSRVTFEITVADDTRNVAAASVKSSDFIWNPTALVGDSIEGVKDSEVDMDSVQR